MNKDESELLIHTMKAIAKAERKHIEYVNGMFDMLCKELGVIIPERRNGDRRCQVLQET